jgi:hypothetical protein
VTLAEIREQPTQLDLPGGGGVHESVFRSWAIVEKVRLLLMAKAPPDTILEIIDDLRDAPAVTYRRCQP